MLGKANEIKISDPLAGCRSVRGWTKENPDAIVLAIEATCDYENQDFFYIIYKEAQKNE